MPEYRTGARRASAAAYADAVRRAKLGVPGGASRLPPGGAGRIRLRETTDEALQLFPQFRVLPRTDRPELKQLPFDTVPVHMLRDGGEQLKDAYRAVNPDAVVPTLIDGDATLQQSLAIIEYLDEMHPEPALLPKAPADRAYVRAIALQIACEIHPLNNLRVLKYLKHTLQVSEDAKSEWYRHWIDAGFASLETRLANDPRTGKLCFGDSPTLADI